MKKTRKVLAVLLAFVLTVSLSVAGTIAYLTDTDSKVNTFTAGNVKIEQYEKDRNGKDFVNGQKLLPIVNDSKDNNGYHLGTNYIDKIVTVKNTGSEAAYIRTHIAFPASMDYYEDDMDPAKNMLHWNGASANDTFGAANPEGKLDNDWYWGKDLELDYPTEANSEWVTYQVTVDDVLYNVYVATHFSAVEAGEETAPNLFGVYLDKEVNYIEEKEDGKDVGYYVAKIYGVEYKVPATEVENAKILVVSEAVQADGFVDTNDNGTAADDALNTAFGVPGAADYNPFA